MNVEVFYATLVKLIEQREGVEIPYTLRKKDDNENIGRDNELCGCSADTCYSRGK